jgi:hypothetical protein
MNKINFNKDEQEFYETQRRKQRIDAGVKRTKYKALLPKDYKSYLTRANKKQLSFELSVEEFNNIRSQSCKYCGSTNRIGIDRLNNTEGYTLENAVPCCVKCNMMKYTYSCEEFLTHVTKIYKYNL